MSNLQVIQTRYSHVTYRTPGLAFIATNPRHERRGAATMLTTWALDRSSKERVSAYLESIAIAGALYQRLGFTPEEKISITLEDGSVYEEVVYLFRPVVGVARQPPT